MPKSRPKVVLVTCVGSGKIESPSIKVTDSGVEASEDGSDCLFACFLSILFLLGFSGGAGGRGARSGKAGGLAYNFQPLLWRVLYCA